MIFSMLLYLGWVRIRVCFSVRVERKLIGIVGPYVSIVFTKSGP